MKTVATLGVSALVGAMLLSGCVQPLLPNFQGGGTTTSTTTDLSSKPQWFYEPSKNGKIGGVGIAKPHVNGRTAQRELAISRALDEIARQMGVSVTSTQKISTTGTSQNASTSIESYSFQTTDGKTVRAHIEAFWEDRVNDELYVWMVADH